MSGLPSIMLNREGATDTTPPHSSPRRWTSRPSGPPGAISIAGRCGVYPTPQEGAIPMSAPESPNPDIRAIVVPPAEDRLGVLSATADVVRATRLVRLDRAALDGLAARWAGEPWPERA